MDLYRGEMTIYGDGVDDHWFMIIEKGINCLQKIRHFNKFQEHNLFENSCRWSMKLKDMQYCLHKFLFSENFFQGDEDI